ncbi:uncharacterized protein LOC131952116 [Physella acuta]|uniref:uncharacterized protein LOC131952116 n=1 Tax=Physella acuta TaxID=109671 RepID=UPI0027DAD855|nr:uncharacterized protein LOC131952116 [Physella acuta]XP_059170740.1 uncharacterized protein LOC131952116 [Physella acuta]XP_059170805.1 uncharacterized protein LOC131952116 [Physella acuta]XP_059170890.1 uncharacterized protein LOC131952116 [Physella acuta]
MAAPTPEDIRLQFRDATTSNREEHLIANMERLVRNLDYTASLFGDLNVALNAVNKCEKKASKVMNASVLDELTKLKSIVGEIKIIISHLESGRQYIVCNTQGDDSAPAINESEQAEMRNSCHIVENLKRDVSHHRKEFDDIKNSFLSDNQVYNVHGRVGNGDVLEKLDSLVSLCDVITSSFRKHLESHTDTSRDSGLGNSVNSAVFYETDA